VAAHSPCCPLILFSAGLTGFAIFISVISILLSLFLVLVPVLYEKYDKFVKLARALKEIRVAFILAATGVIANFLIAFIVTISAWTQPGCKNPDKDPNANKGDGFKKGLQSWCDTKKAGGIFFWLAFIFWLLSLGLLIRDWRQGANDRPRDPPFTHPSTSHAEAEDDEEGDEESMYQQPPPRSTAADNSDSPNSPFADTNRFGAPASRPSMDAYGAFSDPAPSGFGSSSPMANNRPPTLATPDTGPKVSRTMQYADPYAVVRAQLAAGASPSSPTGPPAYESYNEYR